MISQKSSSQTNWSNYNISTRKTEKSIPSNNIMKLIIIKRNCYSTIYYHLKHMFYAFSSNFILLLFMPRFYFSKNLLHSNPENQKEPCSLVIEYFNVIPSKSQNKKVSLPSNKGPTNCEISGSKKMQKSIARKY